MKFPGWLKEVSLATGKINAEYLSFFPTSLRGRFIEGKECMLSEIDKEWSWILNNEKTLSGLKPSPSSSDNEGNSSSDDCLDDKGNYKEPGTVEVVKTFNRRIPLRFCASFSSKQDIEISNELMES